MLNIIYSLYLHGYVLHYFQGNSSKDLYLAKVKGKKLQPSHSNGVKRSVEWSGMWPRTKEKRTTKYSRRKYPLKYNLFKLNEIKLPIKRNSISLRMDSVSMNSSSVRSMNRKRYTLHQLTFHALRILKNTNYYHRSSTSKIFSMRPTDLTAAVFFQQSFLFIMLFYTRFNRVITNLNKKLNFEEIKILWTLCRFPQQATITMIVKLIFDSRSYGPKVTLLWWLHIFKYNCVIIGTISIGY